MDQKDQKDQKEPDFSFEKNTLLIFGTMPG